jgi:hypothetical protein
MLTSIEKDAISEFGERSRQPAASVAFPQRLAWIDTGV